ncbi:MAG TPA: ComF family protein [Candidatus Binataceae bacterium]|nr:ComF family protein [Candidatus Binataceae bacterium]
MLRYLINFIYPPRCAACDCRLPLDGRRRVCPICIGRLEPLPEPLCAVCGVPIASAAGGEGWCGRCTESPPHFSRARAVARYRAGTDEDAQMLPALIRRHKYGLDQSLTHALAECLGNPLPVEGNDYDLIMPVPLHRARLRWRGFNQAVLLGQVIARQLKCPLDSSSLVRVRETDAQTGKDMRERRKNIRDAFSIRRPARIANRRVLLVDDVMTTGATVDECARTLLAAGARRVDVLTLARAL